MYRTILIFVALISGCALFNEIEPVHSDSGPSGEDVSVPDMGEDLSSADGATADLSTADLSSGDAERSDTGDCQDQCELDETRCFTRADGDSHEVCELSPQGCAVWESVLCGETQTCDASNGCVCNHECEPDRGECMGEDTIRPCEEDASGCRVLGAVEECPSGDECRNGQCSDD